MGAVAKDLSGYRPNNSMSMSDNRTGVASEMAVASELSNISDVSMPMGRPRYDLIADFESSLYRVQVKTAYRTGQRNSAHVVHAHGGNFNEPTYYKADEFDILAIHAKDVGETAYFPWTKDEERDTITVWFDRDESDFRPCNRGSVNVSENYTFHDAIDSLK